MSTKRQFTKKSDNLIIKIVKKALTITKNGYIIKLSKGKEKENTNKANYR